MLAARGPSVAVLCDTAKLKLTIIAHFKHAAGSRGGDATSVQQQRTCQAS